MIQVTAYNHQTPAGTPYHVQWLFEEEQQVFYRAVDGRLSSPVSPLSILPACECRTPYSTAVAQYAYNIRKNWKAK